MTGAERVAASRARKKARENAERLRYTSDEWRAFVDPTSLQRKAGASWQSMPGMVLRELADNAADAANGAGAWIEIVEIDGIDWWCVGDPGSFDSNYFRFRHMPGRG
jgi:hypothetical protein